MKTLTGQDYRAMRQGAEVLERDPHGDKVLRLADGTMLKLFRRKRLLSSTAWYPYARRFADNAATLAQRGIPVPRIIDVFRIPDMERDAVHYAPLPGATLREMRRDGFDPAVEHQLKSGFTRFVIRLHDEGIYFRSLHIGNVVYTPDGQFGLIDFSDLRTFPWPLGKYLRARNLRRMQEIDAEADWANRDAIIAGHLVARNSSISRFYLGIRCARALLGYILSAKLVIRQGHLPPVGHRVAEDFVGVGVAASNDPAADAYIIGRLTELGIRHVRLDFTYGDATGPAARLLDALLVGNFRVMLHLVQPLKAARQMPSAAENLAWREFVGTTLDRFGQRVELIEIGSTVNRRRWSGHTLTGFLAMWEISHHEARLRGLRLAGPNVTDFEPLYNIALLSLLESRGQLPDIHTNNLFSERCVEPEQYDGRILGRRLGALLRFNLVRKARLLQKIGADHGIEKLYSPVAFWTLPRIARILPDSEEKQADYLARYFVLCAASGAIEHAFWGPLICHREGLIDDGPHPYPAMERVTHYANITGEISEFRLRPAYRALRAFIHRIPGCRYVGRLSTEQALEIHTFAAEQQVIHVAWTINGCTAALEDIYANDDLAAADIYSRDGERLDATPTLVTEAPIYLCWPLGQAVELRPGAAVLPHVAIHRHIQGKTHHFFRANGWQGILLAETGSDAALLLRDLHPEHIAPPALETTLRHARNAIWTIDDPRTSGARLVVKQPAKLHLHKRWLDRFKPSKALRSWNGTNELLRRGIAAASPVAYFEKIGDDSLMQNYYLCEHVPAEFTARELMSAFAGGAASYRGIDAGDAYRQLVNFLLTMHGRGIFFRDLSGGNILIRCEEMSTFAFSLIDTGRIHVFARPLSLGKRMADLVRICNKLHWPGRERLLAMYFSAIGHKLTWYHRLVFVRYDFKVMAKRRFGRKALKRLFWN